MITYLAGALMMTACHSTFAFDHAHAAWGALLKQHVQVAQDGHSSRVDYRGLAGERMKKLNAYLLELSAVAPDEYRGWTRAQQLAFLINAYNAYTVELVLTRYPDLKSIKDLGSLFSSPWKKKFFTLLGSGRSLDDIEHGLIRAPGVFDDPRIHFALNCASIGCPMLRDEAFTADRLEAQLEDSVRRFLGDRSRNRHEPSSGRLALSPIFDWYKADFEKGHRGVRSTRQFVAPYADLLADSAADRAAVSTAQAALRYLDYDWNLNDAGR